MSKKTLADLQKIRDEGHKEMTHRLKGENPEAAPYRSYCLVCAGTGCHANTGEEIYQDLVRVAKEEGVENDVKIIKTGCFGFCEKGPIVKILPEEAFYVHVKPSDAEDLIKQHIIGHKRVDRLIYEEEGNERFKETGKIDDYHFYHKQHRIALRNCGFIDAEDINEFIACDGYQALKMALTEMTPEEIIEQVKISGMRGRGGAGFPTWMKWNFTKNAQSDDGVKYVVCNADEGDPGAYMDRSTIEGDSHSIIEAMAIAARAIGASQGFIYVRAEYGLAVERLKIALNQARESGFLGKDILGTGFDFDIEIRLGAGAFVCGEETALLASIEGERGIPRVRPPFPAVKGLWGKPTLINNVETFACIPYIIFNGGAKFASIGTEKSPGTKVFALTGKVNNTGLVEVPMGTTLREIIFEIGGGIRGGHKFKAVQTGGPSGGVLGPDKLDTPIDFDTLVAAGSMMGSGGMIVMDDKDCIVDIVRFYLDFSVDESCGKCAPCRIGGRKLLNILDKIAAGKGEMSDIDQIKEISETMRRASLCALGQTTPNPALSIINYFQDELLAHIKDKKCPAGKCKNLLEFKVIRELCVGCGLCAKKCPADAIFVEDCEPLEGKKRPPYYIDQSKCVKCGECIPACGKFKAIIKE
jgi:NADH:ubiquinone oxidoreductase subunit F (NADH-binding)/(2Fe-2S) ferredoxin/NAD-dependent dihydropyrimidine dehydrogenase PreA subunit